MAELQNTKRIYGKKVRIDPTDVLKLYDSRADQVKTKGLSVVDLKEGRDAVVQRTHEFFKNQIAPMLKLLPRAKVLDIGCGMGRWMEVLHPNYRYYCGVDFSPKLLKLAEEKAKEYTADTSFYCMSAYEAVQNRSQIFDCKFDAIIMNGVGVYINDGELAQIFSKLSDLCAEHCVIFWSDPYAIEERLTLNKFESKGLKTTYSAIYRTQQEMEELLVYPQKAGFKIEKQSRFPEELGRQTHVETDNYYFILRR